MAYQCFAVLARETHALRRTTVGDGKRRARGVTGPDEPFGYHATEVAAEAAKRRWEKRQPKRLWRVAKLVEG